MKLLLLLLFGVFATFATAAEPSAGTLKKCPSGHATLKDVPIAYGLPPLKGPEVEKWRNGVENLEFVPGGCVIGDDSPKQEVICTTCRFAHSISSTRRPGDGYWIRRSPEAESFPKPIAALVKSFPVPSKEQQKEPVTYTQSLSDGLQIQFECVSYCATKPADEIKAEVNQWLKEHNIKCIFTSTTHKSTRDGAVRDILQWKTDTLSVSISLHHEHSDKTSSIYAAFYKQP